MARRSKLAKVAGLGLLGALTLSGCDLRGRYDLGRNLELGHRCSFRGGGGVGIEPIRLD